ncbi:hypothetical protein [Actinomadura gamaensis]|uniref:Secreted protein n=1 Tax=Actinomadura gamaensis TaxID=1763541 RepID=A0ABV9U528_9ACTN
MSSRKSVRRALLAAATAVASLGLAAAPAEARQTTPTDQVPAFDYAGCPPLPSEAEPFGSFCFEEVATGGSVTIGNVTHTITADEPLKVDFGSFSSESYPNGFENVFGGLRADRFEIGRRNGQPVYAQPVYTGPFATENAQITLGFKIRFTGGGLGDTCTVGSDADPIVTHLITGTTAPPPPYQPITGTPWQLVPTARGVHLGTLVDNTFAVPAATGCAGDGNTYLNTLGGLPAPAGASAIRLNVYVGHRSYTQPA